MSAGQCNVADILSTHVRRQRMGTPVRDQRDFRVTIRLTEAEKVQLLYQMERSGYLSISRYIRTRCLDGKAAVNREIDSGNADLRSQVNMLSSEIAKIGVNYNQTVRDFKKLIAQTRKDGSPIINNKAANYFLQNLNTKTLEVKALMEHIIELVENKDK